MRRAPSWLATVALLAAPSLVAHGQPPPPEGETPPKALSLAERKLQAEEVPEPDGLDSLDLSVQKQYREVRAAVDEAMADPEAHHRELGRAWAHLAMWAHVYQNWAMAEVAYRNARLFSARDRRTVYLEAQLFLRLGRLDEAHAGLVAALELDPEDAPTLVWLSEVALERGRLDEALRRARAARELEPHNAHAMLLEGQVALLRGQYEEALAHLRDAMTERPDSSRVRYALGLAFRGLGEPGRADGAMRRAMRSQGADEQRLMRDPLMTRLMDLNVGARRWVGQAQVAQRQGQKNRALSFYKRAIEAAPNNPVVREQLASALLEAGRVEDAVKQHEWVARRHPDRVATWFRLGIAYEAAGRLDEAVAAFERGAETDGDAIRLHLHRARLLSRLGREGEALEVLGLAIDLDPGRSTLRLERATLLMQLGRFEEAAATLDRDLADLPDIAGLSLMRARLLASSPEGDQRDGARSLELALDPEREHTVLSAETLAMAYAELGDFDRAVAWQRAALEASKERDADEGMSWVARRLALYEQGRPCREPWFEGERVAARVRVSPPPG